MDSEAKVQAEIDDWNRLFLGWVGDPRHIIPLDDGTSLIRKHGMIAQMINKALVDHGFEEMKTQKIYGHYDEETLRILQIVDPGEEYCVAFDDKIAMCQVLLREEAKKKEKEIRDKAFKFN